MINWDPVATEGLIDSLERPGGNITGLSRLTRDLSGKRLELLKEVVPGISRVGVLDDADAQIKAFKDYQAAGRAPKDTASIPGDTRPKPRFGGGISSCGQVADPRADCHPNYRTLTLYGKDWGLCHNEPAAFNVRKYSVCRGWWPDVLFSQRR